MIHYKSIKLNKGVDALTRRYLCLSTFVPRVLGFKLIREQHKIDVTSRSYMRDVRNILKEFSLTSRLFV